MDRLPLDENGRLAANWLLLSATCGEALGPQEVDKLRSELLPRRLGLVDTYLADTLGLVNCSSEGRHVGHQVFIARALGAIDSHPQYAAIAASLDKGLLPTLFDAGALRMDTAMAGLLPDSSLPSGEEIRRRVMRWADENCKRVMRGIVSFVDVPLKVRWASNGVEEKVEAGGENQSVAYYRHVAWWECPLGETFEVLQDGELDGKQKGEVLYRGVVLHAGVVFIGQQPEQVLVERDWEELIQVTRHSEELRAASILKNYTSTGSKVVQAPPHVWAPISTYYYNNRHQWMLEEWSPWADAAFVNHWESLVYVIPLPTKMKASWQV